MSDEKSKALAAALAQIEKNFGKGSIMKMDGSQQEENLDVISTGSLGVDLALGVGGLPRGRVVEIFGPESSGKTTLCLEAIAQCQKNVIAATLFGKSTSARARYTIGFAWVSAQLHIKHNAVCGQVVQVMPLPF